MNIPLLDWEIYNPIYNDNSPSMDISNYFFISLQFFGSFYHHYFQIWCHPHKPQWLTYFRCMFWCKYCCLQLLFWNLVIVCIFQVLNTKLWELALVLIVLSLVCIHDLCFLKIEILLVVQYMFLLLNFHL